MPHEEVQEEAALVNKLCLRVSDLALRRNGWDVEAGPSIDKELSQGEEVTVAAHYFESTLAIRAIHCIDNVVGALWLLRVAHAPILDHLQLVEAFDYVELALILLILL